MPSRALRGGGGLLLAGWAVMVGRAFAEQHPAMWVQWRRAVALVDWAALIPTGDAVAVGVGHMLAAAAVVLAAACVGLLVMPWLWSSRVSWEEGTSPGERFWLAVVVGFGMYAPGVLCLAAVGVLYAPVLWGAIAAPLVLGAAELGALFRAPPGWDGLSPVQRRERPSMASVLAVCGVVAILLASLAPALSPHVLHDARVYHLGLPNAYLQAHGLVRFPHLVFANTPLNTEMLYTLALAAGGPPVAKLLHLACGIGVVTLTAALGRRLFTPTVGTVAAFFTLATPLFVGQLPTAYVDVAATLAFLAAVWGILRWAQTGDVGPLRVGAVALGLFAGMRYTSLYGVFAVCVAVAAVLLRRRGSRARHWAAAFGPLLLGLVLGAGPWLVKNAVHVGNPVFPIATGLFGLGPLSATEQARMALLVQEHGMGHGPVALALLPWRLTVLGNPGYATFDGVLTPLWLIALPAVVLWRRMPVGVGLLGILAGTYAVAWAAGTHVARYLLPVTPLFSLLAVGGLLRLAGPEDRETRESRLAALGGLLLAGVWWAPVLARVLLSVGQYGPVAWGRETAADFLARTDPAAPMHAYMDRMLPQDAVVMGLWENRMLRCPRRLEGDAVYEAPRWLDRFGAAEDGAALAAALHAEGLTHLLLNAGHLERFPPRATSPEDAEAIERGLTRMRAFAGEQCVRLFVANDMYLYAIRPPAPAS